MLRLQTIRPPFRRFNSAKAQIDKYFNYFKTTTKLRPLIYRPKNANTLIAMDIKDPLTKEPLRPRAPITSISRTLLIDYIKSVPYKSNDLHEWVQKWTTVTTRKREIFNYFSNVHIQYMLIQSFSKIGDYPRMVGFLYTKRPIFIDAKNLEVYDIDHFLNTLIMCSLHRNVALGYRDPVISRRKLEMMWYMTIAKSNSNGLVNLLLQCYSKQQGFETKGIFKGLNEDTEVQLPLLEDSASIELKQKFVEVNENLYLITRTIKQFNTEVSNSEVDKFITKYQSLTTELGNKTDAYNDFIASANELLAKNEQETATTEEPAAEETTKE